MVATICGCGDQGRIQLEALRHTLDIKRVFAWDIDKVAAAAYARDMSDKHGVEIVIAPSLGDATIQSDVIVTCTTSRTPYLGSDHVRAGTFIAAIGADNPDKSEIRPELMARAMVVADVTAQGITMGDLHHAIGSGAMAVEAVHADLGELITGQKNGRTNPDEITLFDSTGTGIQDVAAAARAYERAGERGAGFAHHVVIK